MHIYDKVDRDFDPRERKTYNSSEVDSFSFAKFSVKSTWRIASITCYILQNRLGSSLVQYLEDRAGHVSRAPTFILPIKFGPHTGADFFDAGVVCNDIT